MFQPHSYNPSNPDLANHPNHQPQDDQDDQDGIVGSYLDDSEEFLSAWASSSASVFTPQPDVQSTIQTTSYTAWTPPSATRTTPHQVQNSHLSQPHIGRTTTGLPMASSFNPSTGTSHATGQASTTSPMNQRTVRKSSSGRKLASQFSAANVPQTMPTVLPDPSLFPDPYPSGFGAANTSTTPPVSLFSAGSSSARSSAYTSASPASALRSSVASSDSAHNARHPHQHQALSSPTRLSTGEPMISNSQHSSFPFLDPSEPAHQFGTKSDSPAPHQVGLATTTNDMAHLLDSDQLLSAVTARPGDHSQQSSRPNTMGEYGPEQTRWSSSSAASEASKSSSWGNANAPDTNFRQSGNALGYEWNAIIGDEREDFPDDDEANEEDDMDRTAAIVLAEQGNGEIVHGEGRDVNELYVPPNTTHLLLGGTASPNQLPGFLASILPSISHSLLALDISANFLTSLPPPLASCRGLEELNIGSNPLRVLPTWLAVLTNLRVLIVDSTGITTLPSCISAAVQLHTLSIRNNRMYSLPSWLCLLPALEILYLEGNPFQGPWKALIEPLIFRPQPQVIAKSPLYPPNTPFTPNSIGSTDQSEYDGDGPVELIVPGQTVIGAASTAPNTPGWAKGHQRSSSKEYNQGNVQYSAQNAVDTSKRTRAATLDRDKELQHLARPRAAQGDPQSPRPYTSFNAGENLETRPLSRTKTAPSRRPSQGNMISTHLHAQMPHQDATPIYNGPIGSMSLGTNTPNRSSEMLTAHPDHIVASQSDARLDRVASPNSLRKMKSTGDVKGAHGYPDVDKPLPSERGDQAMPRQATGQFMSMRGRGPAKEEYRALTATMFETPSAGSKDKDRGKWGFLKKMSKGRLRSGSNVRESDLRGIAPTHSLGPPRTMGGMGGPPDTQPILPHTADGDVAAAAATRPPFMTASQVAFRSSTSLTQTSPQRRVLSKRPVETMSHHAPSSSYSVSSPMPQQRSFSGTSTPSRPLTAMPHLPSQPSTPGLLAPPMAGGPTPRKAKRRSFLPLGGPTPLSISTAQHPPNIQAINGPSEAGDDVFTVSGDSPGYPASPISPMEDEDRQRERHQRALRSVMAYLRDMCDLSAGTSAGAAAIAVSTAAAQAHVNSTSNYSQLAYSEAPAPRGPPSGPTSRRPTMATMDALRSTYDQPSTSSMTFGSSNNTHSMFSSSTGPSLSKMPSMSSLKDGTSIQESDAGTLVDSNPPPTEEKKMKDDKNKRAFLVKEIVTTERTYVKLLQELVDIYVKPASAPFTGIANVSSKETIVPASERKIVFNGLESLLSFHKESFLPALELASKTLESSDDSTGEASSQAAIKVAQVFVSHAAFMRMYSTYINNFDNALRRTKQWTDKNLASAVVGATAAGANASGNTVTAGNEGNTQANLTPSQRKRIKQYLKRCRANPRHSQMNMESYLLLPVQRIPRYRLMFEELVRATPSATNTPEATLERALNEITALASNMNEGKREAESRRKLVHWQSRIRGRFPSPLVQPHRRLIMDGRLQLTRVVRKMADYFEVVGANGEKTLISVECLAPEVTPRALTAILCNDLLVLCKDPSSGRDAAGFVDLWAVLRMQTVSQPASIVHGNALRLVDNKAILYFDLPSTTEALAWSRAINMHIPASTK